MENSNNELLDWLGFWMKEQCDGDWEHENQIIIQTLDNPGWYVLIDLDGTSLEEISIDEKKDVSENDWYYYKISKKKFAGYGDLNKLNFLLNTFKKLVDENTGT